MRTPPHPARSPRLAAALLAAALGLLAGLAVPGPVAAAGAPRPKICLALSGGGARGIAHIGVLRVLESLRVPIDCIVGTSAGAIIGGAYASGAAPDEIEAMIRAADWDYLLSDQPPRQERSVYAKELERAQVGGAEVGLRGTSVELPRAALIGQHLQFFLQSLVAPAGNGTFDDLPIPYRALATDFAAGKLVVLDHGDLATAIRASMSVPGAFAPVERDGRLLADGGLVRNLGVDVARELGADVVIAVNVGAPLLDERSLGSILGAAQQTLAILMEQNVAASIAGLGPRDVLITPELGSFSSSDFAHGTDMIPRGERAAREVAGRLAELALGEEDYARWQATHRRPRQKPHYEHLVVDIDSLHRVPARSIERLLGDTLDPATPETTITRLLATDDFESVEGRVQPGPDGATLVLRPIEKPWGPDYLRAGATLNAGSDGLSSFTVHLDQRDTWLTDGGLEWRNHLSLGQIDALKSELRLPLDAARRFFIAPSLEGLDQLRYLFVGSTPLETYRQRSFGAALDLGLRFGTVGEFTAGLGTGLVDAGRTVGNEVVPDVHRRLGDLHAAWTFDRLDNLDFPRSGYLVSGKVSLARHLFAGADVYDRATLDLEKAFGTEHSSLLLALRGSTAFGTALPYYELFSLGGFQNLSGLQPDQVVAGRALLARAVYRHQIASLSALLPAVYAGFSLEEATLGGRPARIPDGPIYAGSVFLSASSALGPLYLGLGLADGGFVSLYVLVGRP